MSAEQRRLNRQFLAVKASQLIQDRLGGAGTVEDTVQHVRIASLSSIAEARSVWDFLVSKGIASAEQREAFLDKAFNDLLDMIESHAHALQPGRG
jgi:hypothetical protein